MLPSERTRYPSARSTVFGDMGVATSEPLAVEAGMAVLRSGGNAVDAAIATAAVLTLTEPVSNGLGSDAFALIWDGSEVHGLNASGRAPAGWTLDRFAGLEKMPKRGWDTVTIPGAVSAWSAMSRRFGAIGFADCLAPAIRHAEQGFGIGPVTAASWAKQAVELKTEDGFAAHFMPGGAAPATGARFVLPGAADALRLIAETEGAAFYTGAIAQAIVDRSQAAGGVHTMDDFAAHTADWVDPVTNSAFGIDVHEIPPNGQGIAALVAVGILDRLHLPDDPDSVEAIHLMIEAVKLALADLYAHVGDPDAMVVSPADMLDPAYLDRRAALIDPTKAKSAETGLARPGGTVILTTADRNGMMVSFIQSNYQGFGSGCVVAPYGISLQNRGTAFCLDPGHANVVGPGKRPFHTIIPGFATKDGEALMTFGVMGGPIQAQGHAQLITRLMRYGQSLQTAIDAPRFCILAGGEVAMETSWPPELVNGLKAMGHAIAMEAPEVGFGFGGAQAIYRLPNGLLAAGSDPRKDGYAAVG